MEVNKKHLVNLFLKPKSSDAINDCIELIECRFKTFFKNQDRRKLYCSLSRLKSKFIQLYVKCCRRKLTKFFVHHSKWMNINYKVPIKTEKPTRDISDTVITSSKESSKSKVGRPKISYNVQSIRSKRRTVSKVSKVFDQNTNLAIDTAKYIAARNGDTKVVSNLMHMKNIESIEKDKKSSVMSPDAALALLLECELTKEQYKKIRDAALLHGHNLFPSYDKVLDAKMKCRPEKVVVNETEATVALQNLVDHTVSRIIESQYDFVSRKTQSMGKQRLTAKLIMCWGFDGSSAQSQFNQKYDTVTDHHETSVFVTSILPLKLICDDETILWVNASPQSVKFCRPKSVKFEKETVELTRRTRAEFEVEVSKLRSTICHVGEKTLEIECDFYLTMLDGKCSLHISEQKSSSVCYICGCPPSKMNNLTLARLYTPNKDMLMQGCSVLHLWMRILDVVTHLSYKLPIKMYQARGEENRKLVSARKKKIQNRFWNELHLRLDIPQSSGGTSTTGKL